MKIALLVCLTLLSGCATIGDLEPLNDAGLEDTRRVFNAASKTRDVMGLPAGRNRSATINRGYGHCENMRTYPRSTEDVPYVTKGYIELERYLRGIYEQW